MLCRFVLRDFGLVIWLGLMLPGMMLAHAAELHFADAPHGEPATLRGHDARHQLLVHRIDGQQRSDVTREVHYRVDRSEIAAVTAAGMVQPLQPGETFIEARDDRGGLVRRAIRVVDWNADAEVHFANQVVPIFTKFSCNGGGCHGKQEGQNGFKLSLLGFLPEDDYDGLVFESRGRRIFPAAPDHSLLLRKAVGAVPHGGGQPMQVDSHEYRLLRRWIAQGAPRGDPDAARVTSISVHPEVAVVDRGGQQQLQTVAHYSDGTHEDITPVAQYEVNDVSMADVDPDGLVTVKQLTGEFAVMARYQGHVGVYHAAVPLAPDPQIDAALAAFEPRGPIDQAVKEQLTRLNIPPAPRCDDATFLRRVTLDLTGRLPTVAETEAFLADASPDRRDGLIDRLLEGQEYPQWFAQKWMMILRNERKSPGYQYGTYALSRWLQRAFSENMPYDQFVRGIVAASGSPDTNPPSTWYRSVQDLESRVEDVAQLFLGQRIQCARCHHHPFEKWSQRDYYHLAAYFSTVATKPGSTPDQPILFTRTAVPTARHPRTGETLHPAGLDAKAEPLPPTHDPRSALVDWMVQAENPYFAKALVNRYWKHFFGRGIVDPEDDLRVTNPPSNAMLLEQLARDFVDSGYDLKRLIRAICRSETYQRAATANEFNLQDPKCYSRCYPRRMTAESLLDAIDGVLETKTKFAGVPLGTPARALPDTSFDSYFLTVFGRPDGKTACECERSTESNLAQSLHLLNSGEILKKLADPGGRAARYASETERPVKEKVRELYLAALSRLPTDQEVAVALEHLGAQPTATHYEDLIWALINTKEFCFNH